MPHGQPYWLVSIYQTSGKNSMTIGGHQVVVHPVVVHIIHRVIALQVAHRGHLVTGVVVDSMAAVHQVVGKIERV